MITATFNLNALNALIPAYKRASGKTLPQVLSKMATKLAFELAKAMAAIAPEKGSIREKMLAMLKEGHGIVLNKRALKYMAMNKQAVGNVADQTMGFLKKRKGKLEVVPEVEVGGVRLNYWALAAQKEIQYREAARFFLMRGTMFGSAINKVDADAASLGSFLTGAGVTIYSKSRTGVSLGDVGMFTDGDTVEFSWGDQSEMSQESVTGMMKPKGQDAMSKAISATVADTLGYRRFEDDFVQSFIREWAL